MALIETNFIRPQEVYDRNTGESKVRYRSYDGNDRFIPVVDGEKGVPKTMVEVTHAELKAMRDGGKLTAGALYRITDYNCTTTQENTRSAGHQFDIVLLALSKDKLAEEGWAMMHENDTYFANSNLSAWKVWYSLDNDKSRFAWADDSVDEGSPASIYIVGIPRDLMSLVVAGTYIRDASEDIAADNFFAWKAEEKNKIIYTTSEIPTDSKIYADSRGTMVSGNVDTLDYTPAHEGTGLPNGRGVIYRLIDEFNNDIKYDFKNIQFKRKLTDGQYDATKGTDTWCYTLNLWYNDMCQDASIIGNTLPNDEGFVNGVCDNKFGYATANDLSLEGVSTFAFALGNNVVLSFDDDGYVGIYSNTIGNSFYSNTIGNASYGNTIGNGFSSNIIGNNFFFNTIGNKFSNKTISDRTGYKNYGNNGVELATKS